MKDYYSQFKMKKKIVLLIIGIIAIAFVYAQIQHGTGDADTLDGMQLQQILDYVNSRTLNPSQVCSTTQGGTATCANPSRICTDAGGSATCLQPGTSTPDIPDGSKILSGYEAWKADGSVAQGSLSLSCEWIRASSGNQGVPVCTEKCSSVGKRPVILGAWQGFTQEVCRFPSLGTNNVGYTNFLWLYSSPVAWYCQTVTGQDARDTQRNFECLCC